MQPLNAVPRHKAVSISAKIRFIRASLVSSEGNIFGAQIPSVFVCNETCDLKHLPQPMPYRKSRPQRDIWFQNSRLKGQHREVIVARRDRPFVPGSDRRGH